MKVKKVFVDADVILDFVAQRQPFAGAANELFALIDNSNIKAYSSSVVISNIYYLLENSFKVKNARAVIKTITKKIEVLAVNDSHIQKALDYNKIRDFEDALQVFCALANGIELLITRNKKDYKNDLGLTIYSAEEILTINDFC